MPEPRSGGRPNLTEARKGSLGRGLLLLELVASHPEGATLMWLAEAAQLDKGTASRLVTTLVELGYLTRQSDRRITLTSKAVTLAHGFEAGFDLRRAARPVLLALSRELGETLHLAVPNRSRVVYVDSVRPLRETAFASIVGMTADMNVTATGRAVLFHLDPDERDALVQENVDDPLEPDLTFDRHEYEASAKAAEELGYVRIARHDNVTRVASAVLDAGGRPLAAIGAFSVVGDTATDAERLGRVCLRAAQTLHGTINGTSPPRA